ncbi:sensor histidine kinase [Paenibacillus sp. 1P07SE]|uniref:sensor histidine kinase n=1 Tax=Paenibacillus sp. 1P07SE TaxID=3132209 RepID=UPI0039A6CA3F
MKPIRPFLHSLRFKLFVSILLLMVPLIVIMQVKDVYSSYVIRNQVAQSNKNLLSLYMNQTDAYLVEVDAYLYNLSERNTDLLLLDAPTPDDSTQYLLARLRLFHDLKNEIEYYKMMDVLFIYSEPNDDFLMAGSSDYGSSFQERAAVQDEIRKLLQSSSGQGSFEKWQVWKAGNGSYYIYHLVRSNSVLVGAWVRADKLMRPFDLMDFGKEGGALLATNDLQPMQFADKVTSEGIDLHYDEESFQTTGHKQSYLIMGEASEKGDFSLLALVPESAILQKLPALQRISSLLTIGAVVFLVLLLLIMRKVFLLPLQRIISAMRKLRDEHWQSYLNPHASSTEFSVLNQTFNEMITEIRNLKINVYEEKLNHQQAELKHLQLQINPHFFLNSLNIIYNLATVRDFAVIQEMTKCLVGYFRFMFRSNTYMVTLKEELDHTRNYLRIQELRFPEHLTYRIEADDSVLSCGIPPLIIQTIVENSIKYGVTMDSVLRIDIAITREEKGQAAAETDRMIITIKDSGPGFAPEVLSALQGDEEAISGSGESVGIWNIKRRLRLLYKLRADIAFRNEPSGGAVVEVRIPRLDN